MLPRHIFRMASSQYYWVLHYFGSCMGRFNRWGQNWIFDIPNPFEMPNIQCSMGAFNIQVPPFNKSFEGLEFRNFHFLAFPFEFFGLSSSSISSGTGFSAMIFNLDDYLFIYMGIVTTSHTISIMSFRKVHLMR